MLSNDNIRYDDSRRWSYSGSINSNYRSIDPSHGSGNHDSAMERTSEHGLRLLEQVISHSDYYNSMSSRRCLPQIPPQPTAVSLKANQPKLPSHSAIEDLLQIFENDVEFIAKGKRLLHKKRKLEQLRAQLNLPEDLTNEDTIKLLHLKERLRAKRKLPNIFVEQGSVPINTELAAIHRQSSLSMPDLTPGSLADSTNQVSSFDLNVSSNSSVYKKRRRKSLFRKHVGPEFVVHPNSAAEKITVPSRNTSDCICHVIVLLPNNNRVQVSCKANATIRNIYETVVTYVDLIEHDLFGLTIQIDNEYFFPAMDVKVSKLITDSKWKIGQGIFIMRLQVKYFVGDIASLRHFLTQHFFYLQFRQMVLDNRFKITEEQHLDFSTLAYQAEYGGFNENNGLPEDFAISYYIPQELINRYGTERLQHELIKRQPSYTELNDVQAEKMFVENVLKLESYGFHLYRLYKNLKQDDLCIIGIRLRDIGIWHLKDRQQKSVSFTWDQIERIQYDKKSFSILLKPPTTETKVKYFTDHSKKGKYLFNLCYDTYSYSKSLLLRHNSRYSILNDPVAEIDFVRNGSDAESIDHNLEQGRSQSQENLSTIGKNQSNRSPSIVIYEVDVYKDNNNSFGISLKGDGTTGTLIKSIQSTGGSAGHASKIQTGDRLLSINGKSIHGMSLQEVADYLSLAKSPCRLKLSRHEMPKSVRRDTVQRPLSVDIDTFVQQIRLNENPDNKLSTSWSHESKSKTLPSNRILSNESILSHASDHSVIHDIKSAVFPVTIDKSGQNSLGFLVVGGLDSEIEDHGIYIKSITPNGAAAKSKLLLEGDKILEVNGASLARVTHAQAVELFRRATGPKCHLLVQRLIFPSMQRSLSMNKIYPFARPENTFEVFLNRGPKGLGLSLSGGVAENKPIEITDLQDSLPAAMSGRLKLGDVVLSVNDVPMHNRNVRDVPLIIEDAVENIKFVVCRPDRQEYQAYLNRYTVDENESARKSTINSLNTQPARILNDGVRDLPPKSPGSRRTIPKVQSKVKRGEVFAVIMNKEKDSGFGFTLSAGSTSIGYPHIRSVLREPALSAGLKHWDRILSINDTDCQSISHRDLVARLRYSPTGPVHFVIYRPRIDEIVHAKERSRQLQNSSYASISVGDQSATSISAPPSPGTPAKFDGPELLNKPVQYETIEVVLPKAPQGSFGIGLGQIDPQQEFGDVFICALQPNGVAEKDGRLKIDDRLLAIDDQTIERMSYREIREVLKLSTKKGVKLTIARPVTDSSTSNQIKINPNQEILKTHDELLIPTVMTQNIGTSVIETLVPREKPKLLSFSKTEKPKTPVSTNLVQDSIDTSTSSASSTAAAVNTAAASPLGPFGSALQALIGKKAPSLPTTKEETTTVDKVPSIDISKKNSPLSNTDIDDDTSDIKTPLVSPQSPVAPTPTIIELTIPPTATKPLSVSQTNEIAKRKQFYQDAAVREALVLNAGVAEKIENLTKQLIDKISTPAITMDTATLMEESREISMKIDSDEYLEEFRTLKTVNEHEPIELSSVAMKTENKLLNRFQNIIPYDFNRVILSTKPDYINASHIVVPFGDKSMKYIICPPPVPDSINDFWQMIVEQHVKCMVGVFNEQDLKKMKCPIYWPITVKTTMTLSPFLSLTLVKQRQLDPSIDIKELRICINEKPHKKNEHSVIFLTYTKWTVDDNIPQDTQSFLNFIHLAHSYQTSDTPLLIHCNTGVGRTGCTLLISLLLIKMIRGRTLDISRMARECRQQRCGIVQTEQQYRFVYECARDALHAAIEHSIMQSAH